MFFAIYDRFLKSIGETYILESWSRIQRAVDFDELKIVGEQIPYSANPFFVVVNNKQGKMMFSGLASTPAIDEDLKKTTISLKDYTTLFNTEIIVDWGKFTGTTLAEYLDFILSVWLAQTDVGFSGIQWDVSALSEVLLDPEIPLGESIENVSLYPLVSDVLNYYEVYCDPNLDIFRKALTFRFLKASVNLVSIRLKDFGVTAIEKSFGAYNRATVYDSSHQKVEQWAITPDNKVVKLGLEGVKTIVYIGNEIQEPGEPDEPDIPEDPDIPDVPDVPDIPDVPDVPDSPDFPEVEGGVFFPYNKNEDEIDGFGEATQDSAAEYTEGRYEVSFSIPANYIFGSFYMRDDGYDVMIFEDGRGFFEYLKANPDQQNTYPFYMNGMTYHFTAVYNSVTGHVRFTIRKENGTFHNCYFYSLSE